jgi:hypothetical protein
VLTWVLFGQEVLCQPYFELSLHTGLVIPHTLKVRYKSCMGSRVVWEVGTRPET